jgi:hypothetical protein
MSTVCKIRSSHTPSVKITVVPFTQMFQTNLLLLFGPEEGSTIPHKVGMAATYMTNGDHNLKLPHIVTISWHVTGRGGACAATDCNGVPVGGRWSLQSAATRDTESASSTEPRGR